MINQIESVESITMQTGPAAIENTAIQNEPGKKKRKADWRRIAFICCCTIPTFILYAIFVLYPVFYMVRISFYKWNGLLGVKTFYGWQNYRLLWQDPNFWKSFQNTVILIVLVTAVTIFLSLYFASILAKGKVKGKTFFRILFYIPNILSIVVISAIFSAIYAPDGVFGGISKWFNGNYTGVLANPKQVVYAIGIAMVWQAVGYYMVMYIAGMDSIPDELYESAGLDGATKPRQFFVITLPLTWQVIRVTLTFFIISTINMSFLFVKAMTNGEPNGASRVLLNYMDEMRSGATGQFGYSMAIGTILFVFAYGLALIVNWLTRRDAVEM